MTDAPMTDDAVRASVARMQGAMPNRALYAEFADAKDITRALKDGIALGNEVLRLRGALRLIAEQCEGVAVDEIVSHAEARTWRAVGKVARAALPTNTRESA